VHGCEGVEASGLVKIEAADPVRRSREGGGGPGRRARASGDRDESPHPRAPSRDSGRKTTSSLSSAAEASKRRREEGPMSSMSCRCCCEMNPKKRRGAKAPLAVRVIGLIDGRIVYGLMDDETARIFLLFFVYVSSAPPIRIDCATDVLAREQGLDERRSRRR